MSEAVLNELRQDVQSLRQTMLTLLNRRLNRQDMADRLDVSMSTLMRRVKNGTVPRPGADGKWLLSEVVEWETGGR